MVFTGIGAGGAQQNHDVDEIGADVPQLAFGVVSVIAAAFLGDISRYMDDHVAVVIE